MYSDALLRRYARDRMTQFHEEAARARLLPSWRTRAASTLQVLAARLEPRREAPPVRKAEREGRVLGGAAPPREV